jgi:hypothetical protein
MAHNAVPMAVVANGTDLTRSDGKLLFRITRGLNEVPEVRGVDTVVPSLNGRIPRSRRLDRLIIEAEGLVMGAGSDETAQRTDFVSLIETLRDLMNPVQDPYNIVVTREDGTTRTITARPQNMVVGPDDIPTFRTASLQWESVDAADWGVSGS